MSDGEGNAGKTGGAGGWTVALISGVFGLLTAIASGYFSYAKGKDEAAVARPATAPAQPVTTAFYVMKLKAKPAIDLARCASALRAGFNENGGSAGTDMGDDYVLVTLRYPNDSMGYTACMPAKSVVVTVATGPGDQTPNVGSMKTIAAEALNDYVQRPL